MAQRLVIIDDINGSTSEEDASIRACLFSYESVEFRLDLGDESRKVFIAAIAEFVEKAQRTRKSVKIPDELRPHLGSLPGSVPSPPLMPSERRKPVVGEGGKKHDPEEVRKLKVWLDRMGVEYPTARLPDDMWAAYHANDPSKLNPGRLPVHDKQSTEAE